MKEVERPLYPRLTTNCTVRIKGHIYKVSWWSNRTYEFVSETTETRIKTEVEVRDLLLQKRIEILDYGLDAAWKEVPKT